MTWPMLWARHLFSLFHHNFRVSSSLKRCNNEWISYQIKVERTSERVRNGICFDWSKVRSSFRTDIGGCDEFGISSDFKCTSIQNIDFEIATYFKLWFNEQRLIGKFKFNACQNWCIDVYKMKTKYRLNYKVSRVTKIRTLWRIRRKEVT